MRPHSISQTLSAFTHFKSFTYSPLAISVKAHGSLRILSSISQFSPAHPPQALYVTPISLARSVLLPVSHWLSLIDSWSPSLSHSQYLFLPLPPSIVPAISLVSSQALDLISLLLLSLNRNSWVFFFFFFSCNWFFRILIFSTKPLHVCVKPV